jgi:hypothetical protein
LRSVGFTEPVPASGCASFPWVGSSFPRSAWEGDSASHPCSCGGLGIGLGKRVALALSVLVCLALVASLEVCGNVATSLPRPNKSLHNKGLCRWTSLPTVATRSAPCATAPSRSAGRTGYAPFTSVGSSLPRSAWERGIQSRFPPKEPTHNPGQPARKFSTGLRDPCSVLAGRIKQAYRRGRSVVPCPSPSSPRSATRPLCRRMRGLLSCH